MATTNPLSRPTTMKENSKRLPTPTPFAPVPTAAAVAADVHDARLNTSGLNSPVDITQFNYEDHWQEMEIDLERVNFVSREMTRTDR